MGSAATADFLSESSDINLLVVFSELDLNDLQVVAPQAHTWWKRNRISPRFISHNNLLSMVRYFPIDFWTMQRSRVVLAGQDVMQEIEVRKEDLIWQLRHEIKGLRTRVKQQFWRTWNHRRFAQANLLASFSTLIHLLTVTLYLKGIDVPDRLEGVLERARGALGIQSDFGQAMLLVKQGQVAVRRADIFRRYESLLDFIRELDEITEAIET
jgi:hypothetical protein